MALDLRSSVYEYVGGDAFYTQAAAIAVLCLLQSLLFLVGLPEMDRFDLVGRTAHLLGVRRT